QKGERLGMLLANMPQGVIGTFGAMKAGVTPVFFDPLIENEEIHRQLNDARVETVVVLDIILPRVAKVFPQTRVKKFIVASVKEYLPFPRNFFFSLAAKGRGLNVNIPRQANFFSFKGMIQNTLLDPSSQAGASIGGSAEAVIQYTSGAEGSPKGVVLTHRNLVANARQAASWMGKGENGKEVFLSILPLHHAYGLTLGMNLPIVRGAASVHLPRFETGQVLANIHKQKITFFPASPSMVEALATYPLVSRKKVSSLKSCWAVGGTLSEETIRGFERTMAARLVPFYGLTEASPLTHGSPVLGKRKEGSVGIPFPNTDARIVDPQDPAKERPVGEEGELIIQGPQVMKAYWKNPEGTEKSLRDGWLRTGDLARMDEEGYFYILGKLNSTPKAS
ncbi:MAG: Long-chain-fatty-acid--CoA ligase, partial [Deltaproteobacteria bacterium]|nr:Long-chain-fatty-acid--CoA ligase [Deltaproteobacteria bacterium]